MPQKLKKPKKPVRKQQAPAQTKSKNPLSLVRKWWFKRRLWQQILLGISAVLLIFIGSLYLLSTWHRLKHQNEPLSVGMTFSATYARSMGLEPKEALETALQDFKPKRVRLVSYWSEHEKQQGVYDFTDLDWQFALLEKYGAKASLAVGLRQPRWPECHFPEWAMGKNEAEITQPLAKYIEQTVNRYKQHPALLEYQLENEYFLKVFGICQEFRSRDRLISEYNLVKKLDPHHRVIVTRSNNGLGWPVNEPIADATGVSVYKRVWDKTVTKRYFDYPFPGWFYGSLAALHEIFNGKPTIIHELQAEPWPPSGSIIENSLEEQSKSMDARRLRARSEYAISSGIRTMDYWGVEWWYWRMKKANDPSLWETGKQIFQEAKDRS